MIWTKLQHKFKKRSTFMNRTKITTLTNLNIKLKTQIDDVSSKIAHVDEEAIKKAEDKSIKPITEPEKAIIEKEVQNAKKQIKIYKNEYDMLKQRCDGRGNFNNYADYEKKYNELEKQSNDIIKEIKQTKLSISANEKTIASLSSPVDVKGKDYEIKMNILKDKILKKTTEGEQLKITISKQQEYTHEFEKKLQTVQQKLKNKKVLSLSEQRKINPFI